MKKRSISRKYGLRKIIYLMCTVFLLGISCFSMIQAEEQNGCFDAAGNWIVDGTVSGSDTEMISEDVQPLTGTYSMPAGWSLDSGASTTEKNVYKQDAYLTQTETSSISCSYIDTNYSILEYEQLRDMLTNNILYSNVNAQISTSAVYTMAKDYLYILIVDDSSQAYRSIYHYVVGDYRCFCVEVKEYRAEADAAKAQMQMTPQEAGQKIAEEFVWNSTW